METQRVSISVALYCINGDGSVDINDVNETNNGNIN